tara:strand:- start:2372 stop:2842 length:471 start_codon:yes stop_codon:yes gene_type:complete
MNKYLLIMLLSPSLFSLEKNMLHCDDIELFFISPADGLTTSESQFKVQFGSKNISINPAGVEVERIKDCNVSGHHHLIINRSYDVRENAELPIPFDANILHFGGGQTEAMLSLPPGKYSLQLALGDYQHKPVLSINKKQKNKIIVSEEINIEIITN